MAQKQFKFINTSLSEDADHQKEVQTEIRRHVMRDIGKARRRRPLRPEAPLDQEGDALTKSKSGAFHPGCESLNSSLAPLGAYPIPGDSRSFELVRISKCGRLRAIFLGILVVLIVLIFCTVNETTNIYIPFRIIWFNISITDVGAFYTTLGNAIQLAARLGNPSDAAHRETRRQYSRSLIYLRDRINSNNESRPNGLIANILAHICLNVRRMPACVAR